MTMTMKTTNKPSVKRLSIKATTGSPLHATTALNMCSILLILATSKLHVHGFQTGPPRVVCGRGQPRALASISKNSRIISLRTTPRVVTRMASKEEVSQSPSSINVSLILQNLANQALIGYTILLGGSGYAVLTQRAHVDPGALLLGVAGVVPMLVLSREIETSESPYVSGLNLSTNMAVLNLFGPRARPALAGVISLVLAIVTGIVEETVFRGQSLPAFANAYGGGDVFTGAVLSTLLFAILHTNPLAFFKGKEAVADNLTLLTLQIINGSIFALLYIFSGNLAVPILTHALYDFYIFYKTHLVDVAGQMEYAEREAAMPLCSSNKVEQMWIEERGEEWLTDTKQSFYLMDTNMDGAISRKELRIALYSYGVYLSEEESEEVKLAADTDDNGEIDFDEYLEFVGPTGSRFKAVKYALLGPA